MLSLDYPLIFYPIAAVAILLSGISKSGFGAGASGLSVPLMSMIISPIEAAGIMLPILCLMDVFGLHAYKGGWSKEHLKALLPGAILGIVIGGLCLGLLSINAIRLIIGLIAIIYTLNKWLGLTDKISQYFLKMPSLSNKTLGMLCGLVSGITGTLAHSGSPPFLVYIYSQKIDKTQIVSTSILFFFIVNFLKLIPYQLVGQLSLPNLSAALILSPLAPIGIWLGVWLHKKISQEAFFRISYWLLFISGIKLIYDAVC